MRLLLEQLRRHVYQLSAVLLLATANQLLLLSEPQVLRVLLDRYVIPAQSLPWPAFRRGVLLLISLAVVLSLLARVARNLQEYGMNVIGRRVGSRLYVGSVAHSLLLPFSAFEDQSSGELLQTLQKARLEAESGIRDLVRLYLAALALVAVTLYAFYVHPALGVVFVILAPLHAILLYAVSGPIERQQRLITRQGAALAGSTTETLRNVEIVKSHGLEEQEISRLESVNDRLIELEVKKLRVVRLFTFVEGITTNAARAALLIVMLWLVYQRSLTTGEFLTFFIYSQSLFGPLGELGSVVLRYREARATFEHLDHILDRPPEETRPGAPEAGRLHEVSFAGVSLCYGDATRPALDGIDLTLRAGDTLALVGPSGSGKSSIVKLLSGLHLPTSGVLTINGIDRREIDLHDLRSRLGVVTHDTYLFAGSVRENLLLVRHGATDEQCLDAVRRAAAMPILERGGHGLDTRIGEGGLKLSGGERQRIAIARALLRQPELLIFDEATSNLDSITERAISETMRDIAASGAARLTVLVAHRLSTVSHANRILVLASGRIAESGTHTSLIAAGGLYAAMWREQSAT
jgi:ATP-binding cassette subfamily B protein